MFEDGGKRVLTWNPVGGKCAYECPWCWALRLIKQKNMQKYQGEVYLVKDALTHKFKAGEVVFVQDMSDLFSLSVPDIILNAIIHYLGQFPDTTFLLLTKNPERYLSLPVLPENCIFGVTIETDIDEFDPSPYAPSRFDRFYWIVLFKRYNPGVKVFISIEPIMMYSDAFLLWLKLIKPLFVYIGYDNYNFGLTEPELTQTMALIRELSEFTEVRKKTLRSALSLKKDKKIKKLEAYF